MDWRQIGEDFRQKYEDTYCRYTSPLSGMKDVFHIAAVIPSAKEAPTLSLINSQHGELLLKYDTEAELDFTFPSVGYFSHKGKAVLFSRKYERQWRKGLCISTAQLIFPYPNRYWGCQWGEEAIKNAFRSSPVKTIKDAVNELTEGAYSVPISKTMALGVSNCKDVWWLWYEATPIAVMRDDTIELKVPAFRQEVVDHCRRTGDYGRRII